HRFVVDEVRDGAAQGVDRITNAEIAPAVAARAGEKQLKAAAAKSLRGDVIDCGAIQHEESGDALHQVGLPAKVANATQVPFAFLAYVGYEQQTVPDVGRQWHRFDSFRNRKKRRQAGSII